MQTAIQLLPYDEFSRLRLQSFCSNDDHARERIVEKSQGHYISENFHGMIFLRLSQRPDELVGIVIDPDDSKWDPDIWDPDNWQSSCWAPDIAPAIMSAIGLGLEAGLTLEETTSRFGTPPHWRSRDDRNAIFHTGGDSPYEVHCHFNPADSMKLIRVLVHRLDIKLPDEE